MAAGSNLVLSVLLRAVDRISGPVRRVQGRLGTFRRQAEAIGRRVGFERLTSSLAGAGKAARDLYATTARLTRRLVLAGTLGAAAMFGLTNATANLGGQTVNVADMLGIHVEQLQALRYAAEQAGLSAGNFDLALRRMIRRTSEAAQGGGPAKDALEELGLAAEALSRKSPEEALGIVADALARVRNQGDRLRIAFALFDTDGAAMVNMLRDGSAGLEQMAARARQLGHVMDTTAARRAERFSGQLLDLQKTLLGVRTTVAVALMPVVGQWIGQLTELIQQHQPQIQAWAQQFAATLPARLTQLQAGLQELLGALRPVGTVVAALVERFGAVQTAVVGLGVVVGVPLLAPLLKTVLALGRVGLALGRFGWGAGVLAAKAIPALVGALRILAAAAVANPLLAIATAIAMAGHLIITNWATIGPWFQALWQRFGEVARAAWEQVGDWLGWDPLALLQPVWDGLVGYFRNVFGAVKRLLTGDWTAVQDLFKWSPLGLLQQGFGAALTWLTGLDWSEVGRRLIDTLVSGISALAEKPVEALRGILGKVRNLLPFSDAKEGPLSSLTASGRAIPGTLAEGVQAGRGGFVESVTAAAAAARAALGEGWERPAVAVPAPAAAAARPAVGSGGGITVQRVDFRPQITIQTSDASTADRLAEAVEQLLERWSQRELWTQVQGVQEVG